MRQKHIFAGAFWTNHVLKRLTERGLSQEMAATTFAHPDQEFPGKMAGSREYRKQFGHSQVTVIARQNEQREWIVISAWIDPPLPGTKDAKKKELYNQYRKAGFWGKLWYTIRQQVGF